MTVDVTASDWMKNPLLWAMVGLGIVLMVREK
jgi:hypothetical protein